MKQTAVEFAVEQLEKFIPEGNQIAIYAILEQAKEMEKEQIIKAYLNVHSENEYRWVEDDLGKELALQYYNETFKSE